jgi:hypothetical protein
VQCIIYKIYFWKVFHMYGKLICNLYALLCCQNFILLNSGCYNPSTLVLRPNPRNTRSSSPCAQRRPHTTSPDLSIIHPPSIRLVLDHSRSSTPSLLLLPRSSSLPTMPHLSPTQHETNKHISPHNANNKIEPSKSPEFKFKLRQVNYSSQIKLRY